MLKFVMIRQKWDGDATYEVRDDSGELVMADHRYYNTAPESGLALAMVQAYNKTLEN